MVTDVEPSPATTQSPHPPLLVGGGGRRTLKLAAREADIVSVFLTSRADGSGFDLTGAAPAAFDKKIAYIRECARDRFESIEINVLLQHLDMTVNRRAAARERAAEFPVSSDDLLEMPFELIGTVQQITDDLVARRDRYCISYITVFDRYMREFAPIMEQLNGR